MMLTETLTRTITLSEKDFNKISNLVYRHCGINLHNGKQELVRARLAKRLRAGKFASFQEYMNHVLEDKSGQEFSILIDTLSTNLTSFFREQQHFEYLRNRLLPELTERKRRIGNSRIRAWSAGCSSGEEPYSIAMTLHETLASQSRWDMKILATDISTKMLEIARLGLYGQERIRPVGNLQKGKYLKLHHKRNEKVFEVTETLKDMVIFKYLNLITDWPIRGPLDFIFCRNVMIYFDKPTQQNLINRFWDLLDSGAVLFTGHSESLTGIEHKFKYVQPTIYMKP